MAGPACARYAGPRGRLAFGKLVGNVVKAELRKRPQQDRQNHQTQGERYAKNPPGEPDRQIGVEETERDHPQDVAHGAENKDMRNPEIVVAEKVEQTAELGEQDDTGLPAVSLDENNNSRNDQQQKRVDRDERIFFREKKVRIDQERIEPDGKPFQTVTHKYRGGAVGFRDERAIDGKAQEDIEQGEGQRSKDDGDQTFPRLSPRTAAEPVSSD